MKLIGKLVVVAAVVLAIGGATMFGFMKKRPDRLSLDVRPHPSQIAALHVIGNDLMLVDSSLRGRSQTGGFNYQSRFGAAMSFDVMWFDVAAKQFYASSFEVDAYNLSTFGEEGIHASLKIVAGPGADVTVTTPHPEALRLMGLNKMDDITPEMDVPVTLLELCAEPRDSDPSRDGILMRVMGDASSMEAAKSQNDNWLAQNAAPQSRCSQGDT
ncbi:MAG: hypothetical protein ABJN34_03810 [Litoreibacter sp.]|uniref:hypothetical protein n=1 Tax=Litoreibacter sp. TaxID=1969459 RepID=UPI003299FB8A